MPRLAPCCSTRVSVVLFLCVFGAESGRAGQEKSDAIAELEAELGRRGAALAGVQAGAAAAQAAQDQLKAMVEEALRDPISVGMLKIDGNMIMKDFHVKPGPVIGHVLNALLEEVKKAHGPTP